MDIEFQQNENQNQQISYTQYEYKKRKECISIIQKDLGLNLILEKYNDLDFNVPITNTNQTWLHLAVLYGKQNLVMELINKGVNINQQDSVGRTPFLIACGMGNGEIIKLFLDQKEKLDTNISTIGGENALMKLAQNAHLKLMDFFIQNRICKFDQENNLQQNVFDILYSHNQFGYVQFFVQYVYMPFKNKDVNNNLLIHSTFKPLFKHEILQNNIDYVIKLNSQQQMDLQHKQQQYEQHLQQQQNQQ